MDLHQFFSPPRPLKMLVYFASRLILILSGLYAGWLLLWNVFRVWPGESCWTVALTNYFALWFLLLLIPLSILMFALKQKYLFALSFLAAILMFLRFIPLVFTKSTAPTSEPTLKVMTFNLYKHNKDIDSIISIILEENPDIVAFQELVPTASEVLLQELESSYPYTTLRPDQRVESQGLISQFELGEVSNLPNSFFLSAEILSPHGKFTLINVHAPKISPYRWRKGWEDQRDFIRILLAWTSSIQTPILLVGDFNTTSLSENYELLTEGFHDAFMDTGSGFGFTFPAQETFGIRLSMPILRIDYIFHNDYLISHETRVLKDSGGSDHRPVVSILSFTE